MHQTKKNKIAVIFAVLALAVAVFLVFKLSADSHSGKKISEDIVFFFKDGCPYCQTEEQFLDDLLKDYPQTKIKRLNVSEDNNVEVLERLYQAYEVPSDSWGYVPVTFLKQKYLIGFDDSAKQEIKNYIENLSK